MVHDSLVIAIWNVKALLALMLGISNAVTGIMPDDLVSEVNVTKYQHRHGSEQ